MKVLIKESLVTGWCIYRYMSLYVYAVINCVENKGEDKEKEIPRVPRVVEAPEDNALV